MLKLIFPLETEDNFDDQPSEEDSNSEYLRIKTPGELNTEDSRNDIDRTDQENSNSEVVITPMKTENYFAQSEASVELEGAPPRGDSRLDVSASILLFAGVGLILGLTGNFVEELLARHDDRLLLHLRD